MLKKLESLVNDLKQIKKSNALKKYIEFIQFPFYRNLEPNSRINFDFPLTIFVGPNGSGKSSTLHSLYGVPEGKTPYDFWFDTAVDPIRYYNDEKKRHSFFYSYQDDNGNELEVVKARIKRKGDPNYWETSRPLKWAGMKQIPSKTNRERNPPIKKNVVYLDFRSELSAFDKYFYFREPASLKSKNKQEYLRRKSKNLQKVLVGSVKIVPGPYHVNQNKQLERLTTDELEIISFILGRKYEEGKIVEHKFFTDWGYSVKFKTDQASYSEAFAESGEVAVVRLVREIHKAPRYSLILLDEPEVSLHPGAQHRLKLYLLEQIKREKHQIILSTHSPTLIEELPSSAIKVFYQNPSTGRFKIDESRTYKEAFYHIELPNPDKNEIIVEDVLSKKIIEAVINSFGKGMASSFEVKFFPGGSTVLKTDFIKVYSQDPNISYSIVFDGDEKRTKDHINPDSLPTDQRTSEKLEECIKAQTGVNIYFHPDGNLDQANDQGKIDLMLDYLKYFERFVYYLPGGQPEQIIWNSTYAENILGERDDKNEIVKEIEAEENYKSKFYLLKNALFDKEEKIDNLYSMFIKQWVNKEGLGYHEVKDIINSIRQN
jgi:predicted ATPase